MSIFKMNLFELIVVLFFNCIRIVSSGLPVFPELLTERIKEFVNGALKLPELQEHVWNELQFESQPMQPEVEINKMLGVYTGKFRERNEAVHRLRNATIVAYHGTESPTKECCHTVGTYYHKGFALPVDLSTSCELVSPNSTYNPIRLQKEFTDACIVNMRKIPTLKWQYFGSEQGVTTSYPATEDACDGFDNRVRPWYVSTNVPEPKNVVVIIDGSRSMREIYKGETLLNLARDVAKTIVITLNPYDKFSVLAFANRPDTWRGSNGHAGCFAEEMATAIPQTKEMMFGFIDKIKPIGGSYYNLALEKAFDLILRLYRGNYSKPEDFPESILHFISDGFPNDDPSEMVSKMREYNEELNHSATLWTYGVGDGDFNALKYMSNTDIGSTRKGVFTRVTDVREFRNDMASFYRRFSSGSRHINQPLWSVPYIDGSYDSLGLVITGSLPVFKNGELIGVVGLDAKVDDVMPEIDNFRPNEFSYAFVMDKSGLLITHPLFPYAEGETLSIQATTFERDPEFLAIFELIKQGIDGNKTFVATKFIQHGASRKYGIKEYRIPSHYLWKKIPGTSYVLCLCLAVNDNPLKLKSNKLLPRGSFLYHRLDIVPPKHPCIHMNTYCSMDHSTVFLSSRTFSDPAYYKFHNFTWDDIYELTKYMEGTGPNTHSLKKGIRAEVVFTNKAQELWLNDTENPLLKHIVWRVIGTSKGVYRIFPGTQMPNNYDPKNRPWYEHAFVEREKIIVTPPYEDSASGRFVVTLSSPIFETKTDSTKLDETSVFAVMAVDFSLSYFHKVFMDRIAECQNIIYRCLLIDSAGYVIVTSDYGDESFEVDKSDVHIAQVEPQVTAVLVQNRIFKGINCSNAASGMLQRSIKISTNQKQFWGSYGTGYFDFIAFKFVPVPETNAYIIIRTRTDSACVKSFSCPCTEECVTPWNGKYCECPCGASNPLLNLCSNEYDIYGQHAPPCSPDNEKIIPIVASGDFSSLPVCYNLSFEAYIEERTYASQGIITAGAIVVIAALVVGTLLTQQRTRSMMKEYFNNRTKYTNQPTSGIIDMGLSNHHLNRRGTFSSIDHESHVSAHRHSQEGIQNPLNWNKRDSVSSDVINVQK